MTSSLPPDQRYSIWIFCPTVQLLQPLKKRRIAPLSDGIVCCERHEHADAPHGALLRARRKRPGSRSAEQRDELAPIHSITSSASESRLSEILMPSALAVFKLITVSNLVGCNTGSSEGFAPLRIRAV